MGLIDHKRRQRDPWTKRFEEHREPEETEEDEFTEKDEEQIETEIERNRRNVGKFEKLKKS